MLARVERGMAGSKGWNPRDELRQEQLPFCGLAEAELGLDSS